MYIPPWTNHHEDSLFPRDFPRNFESYWSESCSNNFVIALYRNLRSYGKIHFAESFDYESIVDIYASSQFARDRTKNMVNVRIECNDLTLCFEYFACSRALRAFFAALDFPLMRKHPQSNYGSKKKKKKQKIEFLPVFPSGDRFIVTFEQYIIRHAERVQK